MDKMIVGQSQNHQSEPGGGLYLPPSWSGLKQQIAYLAQFGGSIQIVQGELGAGKSTLHKLIADDQICEDFLSISAFESMDVGAFLFDVLWGLGLRPEQGAPVGELIASLRAYVQSLQQEGARVVLSIDDAHLIPNAALAAMVSVLQGNVESGIGLHLILFAENGLADRLDGLQLLDVEIHDASIPSFTTNEVEQFLFARGLGLATPSSPEALKRLWHTSKGLPGRILSQYLGSQDRAKPQSKDVDTSASSPLNGLPLAHIAALVVLSCLLVWAFLVREEPESPKTTSKIVESSSTVSESLVPKRVAGVEVVTVKVGETGNRGEAPLGEGGSQSMNGQQSTPALVASSKAASDDQSHLELNDSGMSSHAGLNLDGSLKERELATAVMVDGSSSAHSVATESVQAEDPATDVRETNKAVTEAAQKTLKIEDSLDFRITERKLKNSSANGYVLQLMAISDYQRLREYALAQSNVKNLMIYRARRRGQLMYILAEGFYADKDSASAAIINLPPVQRRGKPWPKSVLSVQQDIAAVNAR